MRDPLYKEGDKVRIKERIGETEDYRFSFVDKMDELYRGKIVTIVSVKPISIRGLYYYPDDGYKYQIKEDMQKYNWASSMFEPISESSDTPLKIKVHTKHIKFNFNN